MRRLLLAAAATALLAPAPSHAAQVVPCEPGYVGVVVRDANGDLAVVCVRDPGGDLDPLLDPWREWLGDVVTWVEGTPVPECRYYPGTGEIECDRPEGPPRPPV